MDNDNVNKKTPSAKGRGITGIESGKKVEKESFTSKKDVDEFDISSEYLNKNKIESDGEDF